MAEMDLVDSDTDAEWEDVEEGGFNFSESIYFTVFFSLGPASVGGAEVSGGLEIVVPTGDRGHKGKGKG